MANPCIYRSYADLRNLALDFKCNHEMHSIVLSGPPGVGKTETFAAALADPDGIPLEHIKGRLTARELFKKIRGNPGVLFLFDDTREILKSPECVNLIMSLTEHKRMKRVEWNVTVRGKADEVEDNHAVTTSRTVVILNDVDEENPAIGPLLDRALFFRFAPTKHAVHEYVGTWFLNGVDRERRKSVYSYVGQNLHLVPQLSSRTYTKALAMFGQDWRDYLGQLWSGDAYTVAVMNIVSDPTIASGESQVKKFAELCGGSRATFFRHKAKLMPMGEGAKAPVDAPTHGARLVSESHDFQKNNKTWEGN